MCSSISVLITLTRIPHQPLSTLFIALPRAPFACSLDMHGLLRRLQSTYFATPILLSVNLSPCNPLKDRYIIGVDEAGRGPIAGPVVAAALVCLPGHVNLLAAADSKVLSEKKREEIYKLIHADPTILSSYSCVSHTGIENCLIICTYCL